MKELRFEAARERRHGLQIMTFEQLAARLAGGLTQPVDGDALRKAVESALPDTKLHELEKIKELPGMVNAAADTLRKAWRAGIDLQACAGHSKARPRIRSVARLEAAVVKKLPPAMMRPADLVKAGSKRLNHAAALFGSIEIVGITELSPVWRPLLHELADHVSVRWTAGPRQVPCWVRANNVIEIMRDDAMKPRIRVVTAATAYHEAIEAMRWMRELLTTGKAKPADIAIASTMPADYDDHFLALRADASLDLHFVHGVKVTASREGQTAAALADVLLRGLSKPRIRRLNTLLRNHAAGPFAELPDGWMRCILPTAAPLASAEDWSRVIGKLCADDWPDGKDHGPTLAAIVDLLSRGVEAAKEAEELLHGRARTIWCKALLASGRAALLEHSLETLRVPDDGLDPCVSACWMPASELAASPRRFVRLLGLNSSRWPRAVQEDRLLSDHIIPTKKLDPLPVAAADRRDFETIMATTGKGVVLSRSRRDEKGGSLGRSHLIRQFEAESVDSRRGRVPAHAFSETDRLFARPEEYGNLPQAKSAQECWRNWREKEITPHDGRIRSDHPLIRALFERPQSAKSLRMMLRNPLGFVWHYGLGWRAPESKVDPLDLDPLAMGNLVHDMLDLALRKVEADGGLAVASEQQVAIAVDAATEEVARQWEANQTVPPVVIWRRRLDEVRTLGNRAFARHESCGRFRSYGEVSFGGAAPKSGAVPPWDHKKRIEIPETGLHIQGHIDRLDISSDGCRASVCDYKTGKMPSKKDNRPIVLYGGKELQRCLYAFVVKALLGDDVSIATSLFYLRDKQMLPLPDTAATLEKLVGHLRAAHDSLLAGHAVMGADTGNEYDDMEFARPANARYDYRPRKIAKPTALLGDANKIWDEA